MSLIDETTVLTLRRSEALILFEILAQAEGETCVPLHTAADRLAASRLLGALESGLTEPFSADYASRLDEARTVLQAEANEAHTSAAA